MTRATTATRIVHLRHSPSACCWLCCFPWEDRGFWRELREKHGIKDQARYRIDRERWRYTRWEREQ